jgi:hypothetical protein
LAHGPARCSDIERVRRDADSKRMAEHEEDAQT